MKVDKVRKKFVLYAELSVFILLTVLLSVINVINFTMVAEDADHMTEAISFSTGKFVKEEQSPENTENSENTENTENSENTENTENTESVKNERRKFGPMGPDSPEMKASLRFFTYAFDTDEKAELIEYRMSALTQSEAIDLARSLIKESTGWTNLTYRYRVYEKDGKTFVTVIDQGRELLPSYRTLIISAIGELLVLLISYLVLVKLSKMLFKQFEEADRKQKAFIANIEQDFKMPLTVISANTEVLERKNGSDEQTKAIDRQIRKMTELVKHLGALAIFEEKDMAVSNINLSELMQSFVESRKEKFDEKKIALDSNITPDINFEGDEQAIKKVLSELAENALRYSLSKAEFTLKKKGDRIIILQTNDTDLSNGSVDEIFDRFTTLANAKDKNTAGLGLSYVKDIVKAHNGRVSAKVANGIFTLEIAL